MSKRSLAIQRPDPRTIILEATETLIVEKGYAAVSARAVAARAGVKPTQVQYYFPKMEELLVAVYRRANERSRNREVEALASKDPVMALWKVVSHSRMALRGELMALANHRKVIRTEIARDGRRAREFQADILARASADKTGGTKALGVAFLISAIGRSLVMEQRLGLTSGHAEARAMVEDWLRDLARPKSEAGDGAADSS